MSRSYRFNPADRTGLLFGLELKQLLIIGSGVLAASIGSQAVGIFGVIPLLLAIFWCFVPLGPMRLYEWTPHFRRWIIKTATGSKQWYLKLPAIPIDQTNRSDVHIGKLPECMSGIEIIEIDAPWARRNNVGKIGIIKDEKSHLLTGVIRVVGREFALVDRLEQQRLIDSWGETLAPFCREKSPIVRVGWTEWSAPSGVDDHKLYLEEAAKVDHDSPAYRAYLDLLDMAGPMVTTHEVLVTLSLDWTKVRAARRDGADYMATAIRTISEELRLFSGRLEGANLRVDDPLTPSGLARALRGRIDPAEGLRLQSRGHQLGTAAGVVSTYNFSPLAIDESWKYIRVDGSYHRTYWIFEWPRLEVPGDWMGSLLLSNVGVRTISMHYEPVSMRNSQRAVDRESTKIAADVQTRQKHGFRVNANYDRAQQAVLDREQEIVSGYTEFEYMGLVTVSAKSEEELEEFCAEYEQTTASIGIDIRGLDGRQADAWVASLPLGRGMASRKFK